MKNHRFTLRDQFIVYGMGKSGRATARAIYEAGGTVYIGDDQPIDADFLPQIPRLDLGAAQEEIFQATVYVILAPGIAHTHAIFQKAKQFQIPVMCDIEAFYRLYADQPHVTFVAITGTNGKSTVTALTTHLLRAQGYNALSGGNIGDAVFDLKKPHENNEIIYVLEISSYQADLCTEFAPNAVVLLNLTPDHLERHGTMAAYFDAKYKLFGHIAHKGVAYITAHELDQNPNIWLQKAKQNILEARPKALLSFTKAQLMQIEQLCQQNMALKGAHQYLNALSACAMCLGLNKTDFSALQTFKGLEHRSEIICQKNGILYINDSKATNAEATTPALKAFQNIYWLAGGVAKQDGIQALGPQDFAHVRQAFLFGSSAQYLAQSLKEHQIPHVILETLEEALNYAYDAAKDDESDEKTILLSPACASFDAFKNFEERGTFFKQLVRALI